MAVKNTIEPRESALLDLVRAMGNLNIRIGMPIGEPKDELILGYIAEVERMCANARSVLETKKPRKGKSK